MKSCFVGLSSDGFDFIQGLVGKGLSAYNEYDMRVQFTEEFLKQIPEGVRPVLGDYYNSDKEFYRSNIEKHCAVFNCEPIFAGGRPRREEEQSSSNEKSTTLEWVK